MEFAAEQHGGGPSRQAAVLDSGAVFELYPARPDRQTGALRSGFTGDGAAAAPPLTPGRHLMTDPDGHVVEILAD